MVPYVITPSRRRFHFRLYDYGPDRTYNRRQNSNPFCSSVASRSMVYLQMILDSDNYHFISYAI
uniref:Bm13013 n=1 Tax=Brugia malayi TaxID=6279 RepID=A0A1I9FZL2_BRUMA|nr:Bm13013 [Brugia malayi]